MWLRWGACELKTGLLPASVCSTWVGGAPRRPGVHVLAFQCTAGAPWLPCQPGHVPPPCASPPLQKRGRHVNASKQELRTTSMLFVFFVTSYMVNRIYGSGLASSAGVLADASGGECERSCRLQCCTGWAAVLAGRQALTVLQATSIHHGIAPPAGNLPFMAGLLVTKSAGAVCDVALVSKGVRPDCRAGVASWWVL